MALVQCGECWKEISDSAKTCPHCGKSTESVASKVNKIGGNVVTIFIILLLVGFFLLK